MLCAAFIFLFANWFLTTISLALVHERVPDRTHYGPLPDVFLDNVPASDWALDVSEILIIISTTSCMVLLFFHKYRYASPGGTNLYFLQLALMVPPSFQIHRDAEVVLHPRRVVHDASRHHVRHRDARSINNVLLLAQVESHECSRHFSPCHPYPRR